MDRINISYIFPPTRLRAALLFLFVGRSFPFQLFFCFCFPFSLRRQVHNCAERQPGGGSYGQNHGAYTISHFRGAMLPPPPGSKPFAARPVQKVIQDHGLSEKLQFTKHGELSGKLLYSWLNISIGDWFRSYLVRRRRPHD